MKFTIQNRGAHIWFSLVVATMTNADILINPILSRKTRYRKKIGGQII